MFNFVLGKYVFRLKYKVFGWGIDKIELLVLEIIVLGK